MSINKDSRIGIIGGGPAGLASALYLQQKGYTNITLVEKNKSVGGKALTVDLTNSDGISRTYELGAEFITYIYDNIWSYCDLVNEKTLDAGNIMNIGKKGASPRFTDPLHGVSILKLIPATIKYLWMGFRRRKFIKSPSNVNVASDKILSMKSQDFIDKYKLAPIQAFFLMKQFGYGTFDSLPVMALYRTVSPRLLLRILGSQIPIIKSLYKRPVAGMAVDGTQGLFKKLADYINLNQEKHQAHPLINTGLNVVKISRNDEMVSVKLGNGVTLELDKLIVAIPPNALLKLMDGELSENEKELLSKFRPNPYYVGTFKTDPEVEKPLPKFYYQNLTPDVEDGKVEPEPVQFTKRWDDTNIVARGYNWELADTFVDDDPGKLEKLEQVFTEFMKDRMGVPKFELLKPSEEAPVVDKYWPTYYTHVSLEDFQAGFYDKFEKLQGENNTYFVGSAMAFESMEQTVSYSKLLVNKFF